MPLFLRLALLAAFALAAGSGPANAHDAREPVLVQDGCFENHDEVVFASNVDCMITEDIGYSSGEPFDIDVVQIDGKSVEVDTANAFLVMQAAAEIDGVLLGIVSGFRSYEEQEYLYDCYINCSCNNCNLAAPPGYSNHNSGHALDLNTSSPGVYDWLEQNAADFGFERTVPSENWHWEWWGGGPGGGQCARGCPLIPKDGRIIEESDDCFYGGGQTQFLRQVEAGHGGGLLWTKATDSEVASNYARWTLGFDVGGEYELAVYTDDGEYGQSTQAAYVVTHEGGEETVRVDQTSIDGWISLGAFSFARGNEYTVRLDDNTGEPWAADPGGIRLMFDALDVVPVQTGDDDDGFDDDPADLEPESTGGLVGGCTTAGQGAMPSLWFFCLLCLLAHRRRRR